MTVRYQLKVENATFRGLGRLLLRWRGSVFKMVYRELAVFLALYALIAVVYRVLLNDEQRTVFEKMCIHFEETTNLVPLTFVLGFYVSFILSRWWEQLIAYPWPDRMCYLITHYINGTDERSYMYRRQLIRYISTATIFVNRPFSALTRKRFPTLQHMVDAGFLTKEEKAIFESIVEVKEHGKFWVPCAWFSRLLDQAKQEGILKDPTGMGAKSILEELLVFRALLGRNWMFNWVNIPVSYTQIVTLAVYTYFLGCLFGRQPLDPLKNYKGHGIDAYFPIFTVLQFIFYVGWLKVAETIFNPWGEDDDDFDINWFIERHMQVHFTVCDQMFEMVPPLVKDRYWGLTKVQLPPVNAKKEALKPGDVVPAKYMDAIGRECTWPPNMTPTTPMRNRFEGRKLPPHQQQGSPTTTNTTCVNTAASSTPASSTPASNEASPGLLPRQLMWDGSPLFPPGHKWYLKTEK